MASARPPLKVDIRPRSKSAGKPGPASIPEATDACHRHRGNVAASHCVVCQKPICLECMEMFGYLCSIGCRYQAEQRGISVPVYAFQKQLVERNWWDKVGRTIAALAGLILVLIGFWF